MLQLVKTNHDYHCYAFSVTSEEFDNWESFKEFRGLDWYNEWLLFRYDLQEDDNNKLYLELHYAGQRHGEKLFHAIVYNLEESDLPEINDYLKRSWDYLRKMWAEVDGTTTEELAK